MHVEVIVPWEILCSTHLIAFMVVESTPGVDHLKTALRERKEAERSMTLKSPESAPI